jgi:hypothetical protein
MRIAHRLYRLIGRISGTRAFRLTELRFKRNVRDHPVSPEFPLEFARRVAEIHGTATPLPNRSDPAKGGE